MTPALDVQHPHFDEVALAQRCIQMPNPNP